jgi:metal-sulfur cluster biosynthetic enzyme
MADAVTKESEIREGLRQVVDPEIGLNIVELGLIRKIETTDENTHLVMMLTTPFCPYGPQLLEQARRVAEQVGGKPATIEMSMEPWAPSMMEEGAGADWGLF